MLDDLRERYKEIAARKRAELEAAIDRGDVNDPITGTLVAWGAFCCMSVGSNFGDCFSWRSRGGWAINKSEGKNGCWPMRIVMHDCGVAEKLVA